MKTNEMEEFVKFSKTLKVLFAEDNKEVREQTLKTLKIFFNDITVAVDGKDGFEKFMESRDFNLILTDINMPKMNGIDMFAAIKEEDENIPCIILSAHGEVNFFIDSIKLGVDGYLLKPYDMDQFIKTLSKTVGQIRLRQENCQYKKDLEEQVRIQVKDIEYKTAQLQKSADIIGKYVIYSRTDLTGVITEASDAFCSISGHTKDELIGKQHNITRHPDMPAFIFKEMWDTIQSGQVWNGEIKNKRKDGSAYWVLSNISPEYDDEGDIKGYISIREDISAQKALEELTDSLQIRIEKEVEKAREKDKHLFETSKLASMGELMGNIAHQWRQPLSTISAIASGVKLNQEFNTLKEEHIPRDMDAIVKKTKCLSEIIETFTDFTNEDKEVKDVTIQNEISRALHIVEATLENNSIQLHNNIDYKNKIDTTLINGELPQVILNILNNAKDVIVEKSIKEPWIKLDLEQVDNIAIITLEDNAGGIPEEIIDKIFDPYFTTKHQSQGTGLGLHMSYKIMTESLKGNLYVQNTNYGAKFFIEVPI